MQRVSFLDAQATEVCRNSPFYSMLKTGASLLRRRSAPTPFMSFRCFLSGMQPG